jgi:hypothetical protein
LAAAVGARDYLLDAVDALFSPDGAALVTVNSGVALLGNPMLWNDEYRRWRAQLCPVIGRDLTAPEWSEALPDRRFEPTCL